MKDLRHHKKSMGMRAWQRAAAKRRGKYGDTLTIAQLRKDTRIPKSIMNDELLLEKANAFKERWAQGCIGAPLPVVNEAVVLIIGALWEVCGVREPTRELFWSDNGITPARIGF